MQCSIRSRFKIRGHIKPYPKFPMLLYTVPTLQISFSMRSNQAACFWNQGLRKASCAVRRHVGSKSKRFRTSTQLAADLPQKTGPAPGEYHHHEIQKKKVLLTGRTNSMKLILLDFFSFIDGGHKQPLKLNCKPSFGPTMTCNAT